MSAVCTVISAHTEVRREGYFRREWRLAVERAGDMAENHAFLVPVVIDGTVERGASVPEKFRELQWTRLPEGQTSPEFVKRVARLLRTSPGGVGAVLAAATPAPKTIRPVFQRSHLGMLVVAVLLALALGYWTIEKFWIARRSVAPPIAAPTAPAVAPPPHSIALLPFVNMSGDSNQEYFSDGLTEEILNSVAKIDQLHVAASTSSFLFKNRKVNVATIARELNVGVLLEGSVRRSGRTVRVTAEFINAATGYDLWTETFDRDLDDILKLQSEIANAVANALKVTLLGNLTAKVELGGTRNPDAFDAYLRATRDYYRQKDEKEAQAVVGEFTTALNKDPDFALAYAGRSFAINWYATEYGTDQSIPKMLARAQEDAQHAIALAPNLAEGHRALARYYSSGTLDFKHALEESERAVSLAPGSAEMLRFYGLLSVQMGHTASGIDAIKKAVALDPLSALTLGYLGSGYWEAHQFDASIAAFSEALKLDPDNHRYSVQRALNYYAVGDLAKALKSCEAVPSNWQSDVCLAITYYKLDRRAEAERIMQRTMRTNGDAGVYQYADIEAQWGNTVKALEWLERAVSLHQAASLKELRTDPLLDPLRADPRFQAIQKELNFP